MSDLDASPVEVLCEPMPEAAAACEGVTLLEPRAVPLGGPRHMDVRRTLPQRERSLIGAWCFLDHYGPDNVAETGGMNVPRHPHTGLQTVSWLFTGEIEHRDSAGFHQLVRPGEVNLMTAGRGISHSEFATASTQVLHGAQLWLALPEYARHLPPTLEHHAPEPVVLDGAVIRVFLGDLAGSASPIPTHHPTVGAEILIDSGASVTLTLDPDFEHGILLDAGELAVDSHAVPEHYLTYLPTGRADVVLSAGQRPVRALIIGGAPLTEQIVMWWNFVGRSHEEIVEYRRAWQTEIGAEPGEPVRQYDDGAPYPRFGTFPEGTPPPLPAPVLPNVRLRPREQ